MADTGGEEVVISGLSGRFPESDNIAEFRGHLINGDDMITEDDRRWEPGNDQPKYLILFHALGYEKMTVFFTLLSVCIMLLKLLLLLLLRPTVSWFKKAAGRNLQFSDRQPHIFDRKLWLLKILILFSNFSKNGIFLARNLVFFE